MDEHIGKLKITRKQQIHWIGIGCSMRRHKKYDVNFDQQYPLFLREIKNYYDVEIHLVLIDPDLEDPPLCVCDNNKNYEKNFIKYGDNYIDHETDIYVYCYRLNVNYIENNYGDYIITDLLIKYKQYCQDNNYLLFLHDFVNRDLKILSRNIGYSNPKQIMIGISLLSEQNNCHMNMSELHNQPLVLLNQSGLLEIWTPVDQNNIELANMYVDLIELSDVSIEMKKMKIWIDMYIKGFIDPFIAYICPLYRQLYNNKTVNEYIINQANFYFNNIFNDNLNLRTYLDNIEELLFVFFNKINSRTARANTQHVIDTLLNLTDLYSITSIMRNAIESQVQIALKN